MAHTVPKMAKSVSENGIFCQTAKNSLKCHNGELTTRKVNILTKRRIEATIIDGCYTLKAVLVSTDARFPSEIENVENCYLTHVCSKLDEGTSDPSHAKECM